MNHPSTSAELGSISFTHDQENRVSHLNELRYPGNDAASLIQAAIRAIELALSHSLSTLQDDDFENNALLILQGISKLTHSLDTLRTSMDHDHSTLKMGDNADANVSDINIIRYESDFDIEDGGTVVIGSECIRDFLRLSPDKIGDLALFFVVEACGKIGFNNEERNLFISHALNHLEGLLKMMES